MKKLVGIDALDGSPRGRAVTIGTFDGLHLGHRALVKRTLALAEERDLEQAVLTWDRHPMQTLRPEKVPPLLTAPERKIELLEGAGVDLVAVLAFDDELSHWPPERFVHDVLVKGLATKAVVVGDGWRFGHKAAGDIALLRALGDELGFLVEPAPLVELRDEPVSSSRTRRAVAAGEMELARDLLGRAFDVDGAVLRGDRRGTELGFPTANMDFDPSLARPPRGVYAGRARAEGLWYPAAINVGVNPTFGGDPSTSPIKLEAYLLGFEGDLYDRVIRVELWHRLRDEERFDSVADLVAQMRRDVARTAELVS